MNKRVRTIAFTLEQEAIIDDVASSLGQSFSAFLRGAALEKVYSLKLSNGGGFQKS